MCGRLLLQPSIVGERQLPPPSPVLSTGTGGLDEVLHGGLTANRVYLVEGDPGSGKTTLALRFLLEGVRLGEPVLYVTLSETREELTAVAASHGWSLEGIDICELLVAEDSLKPESQYTIFQPSEVELTETISSVLSEVDRLKPRRVVFDSLSEVRLLAQNSLRYRRQTLALKQFFTGKGCTVLLIDDRTSDERDLQLHSIAHGVITLEQTAPEYGTARRRMRVMKMRGRQYRDGYHDFVIARGGLQVFPRLIAAEHRPGFSAGVLTSGVSGLDEILGGGVDRGTSTLLMGPAGTGKSTLALQFAVAGADAGERAVIYMFDESLTTFRARAAGLGLGLDRHVESGAIVLQQIDPAELSPGELSARVRDAVEAGDGRGATVVVLDSLNGYLQSMPAERYLVIQLHELLTYLGQQGVATFLVVAQHGLVGMSMQTPVDATYLADSVILLRFFEAAGVVRQAISVMKRRGGRHEHAIREMRLSSQGVWVGKPLHEFQGVLSGIPTFVGNPPVLADDAAR